METNKKILGKINTQRCSVTLNTAITVKLLNSKVTLLNICEKLKMTQRDTGNIKSKVNETCTTCHK